MSYTIVQKLPAADKAANAGSDYYLNHAYLHTLSFGSADMMWSTEDHGEAIAMLKRVKTAHRGKRKRFQIKEV